MAGALQLPYKTPWFTFSLESAAACLAMCGCPSAYNAVLNQCVSLSCGSRGADGFGGLHVEIPRSRIVDFSCLEQYTVRIRSWLPHCRRIVRDLLRMGFYLYYRGAVDPDLSRRGGVRRGDSDGILCGYDDNDGTYRVVVRDSGRCLRLIWIPQECLLQALRAGLARGTSVTLTAYRMRDTEVTLNEPRILRALRAYIGADTGIASPIGSGVTEGIAAQDALAHGLGLLACGEIPLSRADRQAFCAVFEHRKCMLDRLVALERRNGWGTAFSSRYRPLADRAYRNRILYEVCCRSRRPDLLKKMQGSVRAGRVEEYAILSDLLRAADGGSESPRALP